MRFLTIATGAALALASTSAKAALVVDTGTPSTGNAGMTLDPSQDLAGYFTLGSDTIVSSVQGYIASRFGSTGTINIFSDAPLPVNANRLFSGTFDIGSSPPGKGLWQGVTGKNWSLVAGNYWVSFSATGDNYMPWEAPSPLAKYTNTVDGVWNDVSDAGNFSFGLQIESVAPGISAAPEPATWMMMIGGFGLVGFALRRRQKVSTRVSYAA